MSVSKKHHYVPVFYQKGFGDTEGLVCRYDRKTHEHMSLPPKVNCVEEDLYSVKQPDGKWDRSVETKILSVVDGAAALVIRGLVRDWDLHPNDVEALSMFISLEHTRLPSFGRAVKQLVQNTADQWLQLQFGTVERAHAAFERYEQDTGNRLGDTPERMIEAIASGDIRAEANNIGFIQNMFGIADTLEKWLMNSSWTILMSPNSTGFITCDHPFTILPPQGTQLEGVGYGIPNSTYYFPLKRNLCLQAQYGGYRLDYRNVDSRYVRKVNMNIAANSERFIMGPNRVQLEAIVQQSQCQDIAQGERYSVEVIQDGIDSFLTKFVNLPGRYFY